MNILPGATFIDTQQVPMELKRHRHGSSTSLSSLNKSNKSSTNLNHNKIQNQK